MKLLTLNTHSLIEPDYEAKREIFVNFIAKEQPEVFALQEVNQTADAPVLKKIPAGYLPCPGNTVALKADNHAAAVARMLEERGVPYHWCWFAVKIGYDKYDEGMAVFSRAPITAAENTLLSRADNYSCWKTRRALGVCADDVWYYAVHMGWWNDKEEPFPCQWEKLSQTVQSRPRFCWGILTAKPMCAARGMISSCAAVGRTPIVWRSRRTKAAPLCRPLTAGGTPRMQRPKSASTRFGVLNRWL